jgi:hypothetical protein
MVVMPMPLLPLMVLLLTVSVPELVMPPHVLLLMVLLLTVNVPLLTTASLVLPLMVVLLMFTFSLQVMLPNKEKLPEMVQLLIVADPGCKR